MAVRRSQSIEGTQLGALFGKAPYERPGMFLGFLLHELVHGLVLRLTEIAIKYSNHQDVFAESIRIRNAMSVAKVDIGKGIRAMNIVNVLLVVPHLLQHVLAAIGRLHVLVVVRYM